VPLFFDMRGARSPHLKVLKFEISDLRRRKSDEVVVRCALHSSISGGVIEEFVPFVPPPYNLCRFAAATIGCPNVRRGLA
jgi:hypothetical protein